MGWGRAKHIILWIRVLEIKPSWGINLHRKLTSTTWCDKYMPVLIDFAFLKHIHMHTYPLYIYIYKRRCLYYLYFWYLGHWVLCFRWSVDAKWKEISGSLWSHFLWPPEDQRDFWAVYIPVIHEFISLFSRENIRTTQWTFDRFSFWFFSCVLSSKNCLITSTQVETTHSKALS